MCENGKKLEHDKIEMETKCTELIATEYLL